MLAIRPYSRTCMATLDRETRGHTALCPNQSLAGPYQRRVVPIAGHFLPRETPEAVVQAVREIGSQR
jgi:hypothetical protein